MKKSNGDTVDISKPGSTCCSCAHQDPAQIQTAILEVLRSVQEQNRNLSKLIKDIDESNKRQGEHCVQSMKSIEKNRESIEELGKKKARENQWSNSSTQIATWWWR